MLSRYDSRNSSTNRNVRHLIKSANNLRLLRDEGIVDDTVLSLWTANIISRFIIEEISDKAASVIMRTFFSSSEEG